MQFVIRGNTIRVMAYRGYDSVKKRAKVELIGTLTLAELEPNNKLLESCTDKEKLELEQYINNERHVRSQNLMREKVQSLAVNIDLATDAIRDETYQLSDVEASELYLAIEKLTKQMKKAGFIRAKP